ncbi:stage II sporulation protein M [Archaeoglobus veneficus]|uniref:Stage II sporulation protein M n=1 Tax=Archaeoglobus veneficus (strain DSM 11195 / SNP6) TaxID=693661 RepID=F2KRQ8_ARCVS|nr:stage II sporulation protein M [Archaeoglobus veneficus]AEA47922.1 protein of unknown function DUF95 transmembrane [Archaeoglobus veneficus SNP6]
MESRKLNRIKSNGIVILLSAICYFSGFFAIITHIHPPAHMSSANIQTFSNDIKDISDTNFNKIVKTNTSLIALLLLGSLSMGLTTLLNLTINGASLGILIATSIQNGATAGEIILLTTPHGIFEIPAIIIAGAAGFKIPYEIIRYLAGRKEQILTKEDIKEYSTMALISIILIVIAAWIEANVTLKIAEEMIKSSR